MASMRTAVKKSARPDDQRTYEEMSRIALETRNFACSGRLSIERWGGYREETHERTNLSRRSHRRNPGGLVVLWPSVTP